MATDAEAIKPVTLRFVEVASRAEVAELVDALDSKSSGASPRAGSTPAFGIGTSPLVQPSSVTEETYRRRRS